MQRLEATIVADSQEHLQEAGQAIDDNPKTLWHTAWQPSPAPMPHHLILDLRRPVSLRGLTHLPRQDQGNGRIAEYEVRVSDDGEEWSTPVGSGVWSDGTDLKTVRFSATQRARYVKLIAKREMYGQPYASAAEIGVLLAP